MNTGAVETAPPSLIPLELGIETGVIETEAMTIRVH